MFIFNSHIMLSVIIIAKNEAHNIRRCLDSVKWADEIVVLDSGSEDETVAIAKEYTDIVQSTDWQGYGIQKQRALARATQPWVLNLDADEYLDEALQSEIIKAMQSDTYDAYRVPIRMCFKGKALRYSSSPQRHVRLFKREGANFCDSIVHEKIVLAAHAPVGKIKSSILHQSFQDLSHALYKINRYSSYSARIRLEKGKSSNVFAALAASSWMFFRCYFLQRGIFDGQVGFLFALLNAQAAFYRRMKLIYPDIDIADLADSRKGVQ